MPAQNLNLCLYTSRCSDQSYFTNTCHQLLYEYTTVVRGVNWLLVKRSFVRFVRRTKSSRSWFRPRNDLWQPSRSCGAAGSRGTLCSSIPSYNTTSNSFIAFTFSGLFLAHSSRSDYWIRYTAELNWFSPVIARFTTVLYAREHTHEGTG